MNSLSPTKKEAATLNVGLGATPARRRQTRRSAGFTLIELMIVVAIVAILTAIAYPAYTSYVVKTHRVAAEGCLSEYANYMERYYTTNLRYDKAGATANALPALDCASAQRTGPNYDYALAAAGAATYSVTATPSGAQLARDTKCGTLAIDQTGARTVTGTAGVGECW